MPTDCPQRDERLGWTGDTAIFCGAASYIADKDLKPPFITILASGGHTAIVAVKDYYNMTVLGSTLDDAVGEAFDKVARVIGLKYPGGPNIERLAALGKKVVVVDGDTGLRNLDVVLGLHV